MQEYIKILEELRKQLALYADGNKIKQGQAIENLIKAYKELKEENEELKLKNNAIKRESEAYAERMINIDNELNLEKDLEDEDDIELDEEETDNSY